MIRKNHLALSAALICWLSPAVFPVRATEATAAGLPAFAAAAATATALPTLDIDGNNANDALTDGLLLLRYFFGFRGDALIAGAVAADCTRCSVGEIEAYLTRLDSSIELPALLCDGSEGYCSEIVAFEPDEGTGYIDYHVNGETVDNQYRSYIRRDVMIAVQYAAARVVLMSYGWTAGNGAPVGLGDMSEADGSIPGTSIGQPGHPPGTHTNGTDIDVAYFQDGTEDNFLRPVCPHELSGLDQYHCVAPPDTLDAARTALFIAALAEHPQLRVIGVDGQIGLVLETALDDLEAQGMISSGVRTRLETLLVYEVTDGGMGWFYNHHFVMHVSFETN